MKKIILGIHGLGNKPPKPLLEQWWRQSIIDGIRTAGHHLSDFPFEMVYWADLLHPHPLDPEQTDPDHDLYISEPYQAPAAGDPLPYKPFRRKLLDYLEKQMDKLLLNDDYSINFTAVTDSIIHHYFYDLDCYYSTECMTVSDDRRPASSAIRERLNTVLYRHRKKDILLLSHSMGSIIAYDVLTQMMPGVKVDTWITAGSPLGLPVVISKIVSEQKRKRHSLTHVCTPENVLSDWINYSDLEDKVAIDYALAGDYKANSNSIRVKDVVVTNRYVCGGKTNAHKSFGYFQTPECGEAVYGFLTRKKPAFWRVWMDYFREKLSVRPLLQKKDVK